MLRHQSRWFISNRAVISVASLGFWSRLVNSNFAVILYAFKRRSTMITTLASITTTDSARIALRGSNLQIPQCRSIRPASSGDSKTS